MISIIRKYQKSLMLVVAVLTVIAFAWLYNPAETRELGANVAARVHGRPYTQADLDRLARSYELALALGEFDLIQALGGMARNDEEAVSEYVWNLIVLRHGAAEMGIVPTDGQVVARLKATPAFLTDGRFDPAKFDRFATGWLGPRGMTAANLEAMARDALTAARVREVVGSAAALGPGEIEQARNFTLPADLGVARFPLEPLLGGQTVSDDEARAFYGKNQPAFVAPEKIAVEYAVFRLDEAGRKAGGKDRVAALQGLAGRAAEFAGSADPAAFADSARKAGAEVKSTGGFDRQAAVSGVGGLPAQVAQAAFLLGGQRPVGDVVQAGDEFYVVRLVETAPERQLAFEEARDEAVARLKKMKAQEALRQMSGAAVAAIRAAMAQGRTFEEAAKAAGVSAEMFSGVAPDDRSLPRELAPCLRVAPLLAPGRVSNPVPTSFGEAAVAVISRGTGAADKDAGLRSRLLDNKQDLFFASWLAAGREAAGIVVPRRGRQ